MLSQSPKLIPVQRQTLKLKLSQRLLQSIRLMAMPLTELRETIQKELERNPALEIVKHDGGLPLEQENPVSFSEDDLFSNSSDPGWQTLAPGDSDSRQRFLENIPSPQASLGEHLIGQVHFLKLPPPLVELIERLIGNLDEDGFHRESPELIAGTEEVSLLPQALEILQGLDPQGCGCSNWRESLELQARLQEDAPAGFEVFLAQALPMLETCSPEETRNSMGISKKVWDDWHEYLPRLNPFPGRLYSRSYPLYIIPDLEVRRQEGENVLILNEEALPVLRIEPLFEELREEVDVKQEDKKFLTQHVREARMFINSLSQRENTLLRTARSIVEFQRDFFRGGPRYLRPLTLKDVANVINVHETTVSRITTNKYIQTEWGLYELKYFFSNSVSGTGPSGSQVSKVAAKEAVRSIINEASKGKKLSDKKIVELLARRGINIARRTVNKYRNELELPASYFR